MSVNTNNPVTFTMPTGGVNITASFTASTTSACTFPVTINSSPSCILQAFQQSGYWSLLSSSQQAAAQSDPAGWLAGHPYLYDTYPQYFAQTTSTTSTTTPPPSTTTYTVTFGVSGSGSVTPSGTQYYNPGATVNITASPASGWAFVQWQVSGNISIANYTSTSTTATVNGNGSVTALFEQVPTEYVTFNESGLPSGVQWTVTVGGSVYSANSGQPINIQCSSGQTISYQVNMVVVGTSTETCYYYPNGQSSLSGTASCGATVNTTYQLHACYKVGMT